jgi:hypothetical protein
MARARYRPKDLDRIFDDLERADDRAFIAVAGALVENALESTIIGRLRAPSTEQEQNVFFHDSGIIRTFGEKIWLAFFLKIIGPRTRRDIDLIRLVRNQAAHDMNPISFSGTPEIKGRCLELAFPKTAYGPEFTKDPKACFDLTARFYAANLWLRAGDRRAQIHKSFKGRASALDR